jgi:hypothetical protein
MEKIMEVPESLRRVLEEVQRASEVNSDVGRFANTLRMSLEAAIADLAARDVSRPSRRGTGDIKYAIERTQQGEVLSEIRTGGKSKPFRCPREVYFALAAMLEDADRPLGMDEIMSTVEQVLEYRPPDHQVRVPLRLWMHIDPPLLRRSRARHAPILPNSFLSAAAELWERLQLPTANSQNP